MASLRDRCTITVVRYEFYPPEQPTGVCVGFAIECQGRNLYKDTIVPLADIQGKSSEEVAAAAWPVVRPIVEEWVAGIEARPAVLGAPFDIPE